MDAGRFVEAVQAPAPLGHSVHDLVNVHLLRLEGDDKQRIPDHLELGYLRDPLLDLGRCLQDSPRGVHVPLLAYGDHGCPARRAQRPRPAPCERRRAVQSAGPFRGREVLVVTEFVAPIEHHRCALGGVAELVRVSRHRGDARQTEVEWRHVVAQLLRPRQDEPAEAGIGVETDATGAGQLRQLFNRVDQAMRKRWC